jgi:hypothetical protein
MSIPPPYEQFSNYIAHSPLVGCIETVPWLGFEACATLNLISLIHIQTHQTQPIIKLKMDGNCAAHGKVDARSAEQIGRKL